MIFLENRLPADDSHEISCLICYFLKSGNILNCRVLQIIGGALWVKVQQKTFSRSIPTLHAWVIFHAFIVCRLLTFFQNLLFQTILSGTLSACQMVWIQIRSNILSILIFIQSVCKDYGKFLKRYGLRREKTCLRWFANNKDADQPAHPRSLINAFFIDLLESITSRLTTSEFSIF